MTKLIDLSHEIFNSMPIYPGDIEVELENDKTLLEAGYCNHNLKLGMHAGTHLDLPAHMINDSRQVADISLSNLSGPAKLINAKSQKIIRPKTEYLKRIQKNDIVIIYTGFEQKYGSSEYYTKHPLLSDKMADLLLDKEIKLLGLDLPSPDYSPFKIHKKLFNNNIFILENLCNLEKLIPLKNFKLLVFPLKIRAEAAPCRVAAEILTKKDK